MTAEDRQALATFLRAMSADSLYFRGCGQIDVGWLAGQFRSIRATATGWWSPLEVLTASVAHASYVRIDEHRAAVAFKVADSSLHGHGIGTLLLGQLAAVAVQHGIDVLVADVMATNRRMLDVLSGAASRSQSAGREHGRGLVSDGDLRAGPGRLRPAPTRRVFQGRLLRPASVAVVGASRNPESIGGTLLANSLQGGFTGPVYPVNPHAGEILGLRAYRSVLDLPEAAELVVIAVPRPASSMSPLTA